MAESDLTANAKRRFVDAVLDLLEEKSVQNVERYLAASQALDNWREARPLTRPATARRVPTG